MSSESSIFGNRSSHSLLDFAPITTISTISLSLFNHTQRQRPYLPATNLAVSTDLQYRDMPPSGHLPPKSPSLPPALVSATPFHHQSHKTNNGKEPLSLSPTDTDIYSPPISAIHLTTVHGAINIRGPSSLPCRASLAQLKASLMCF